MRCCVLLWLLLSPVVVLAQHMLERVYTVQDGLPSTETFNVVEDRLGYIWANSTSGQLSRFDGQRWQIMETDKTARVGIGQVIEVPFLPDAYARDHSSVRPKRYFLLRGDEILMYPIDSVSTHGVDLRDSSLVLIKQDSLHGTYPGSIKLRSSIALPNMNGLKYQGVTILPSGGYYLNLRKDGSQAHTDYSTYYWDGEDSLHQVSQGKRTVHLADGTFWEYLSGGTEIVLRNVAGNLLYSLDLDPSAIAKAGIERIQVIDGQTFVYVITEPIGAGSRTFTVYTIEDQVVVLYGAFEMDSGTNNRITIAQDGTVWGAGHSGTRRMIPHTETYRSDDVNVVGSLHGIGQLANGDVYLTGYGTGMMRIRNRVPERLTEPPFSPVTRYLPGSFATADGGIIFNDEQKETAIHYVDRDGKLFRNPMGDAYHGDRGFQFTEVVLPADAPILRGDFTERGDSVRMIACSMTASAKTGEPSGRIGLMPLPYSPDKPFYTVGHNRGIRTRNVLCTAQDKAGRIWFGHGSTGIGVYDPVRDTAVTWLIEQAGDPGSYSIAIDKADRLWFGNVTGLQYVDSVSTIALQPSPHLRTRQKMCRVHAIPKNFVGSMLLLGTDTLAVGHAGGLSLIDLNSPSIAEPRAVSFPIADYIGASEQNGILRDRDGHLWLIGDVGVVRLNLRQLLRGRRMRSAVEVAMYGDRNTQRFVNEEVVTVPAVDRSLSYSYQLGVFDQVQDITRTEMLLRSDDGDTVNYAPALSSGKVVRQDYLEPGNYTLQAKTYFDNELVDDRKTEIRVPKQLPEHWWFWPGIVTVVVGFIGAFAYARQQRIQRELDRTQLESERRRIQLEASELRSESDRLQISTLSNAVNPHFINNAITWLQSAYLIGRPIEKMNEMSDNLAKTIRTMFTNSTDGRVSHGIDDELMLVERYLRTVNIQYDDRYAFELPTAAQREALAGYEVLLMQVQVHVENAVNHGLRYRPRGKRLVVRISESDNRLHVEVEDHGAGVAFVQARQARQETRGPGRGTTIMRRLQETFNRYNETALTTEVISPILTEDDGTPYGTRVLITIPKSYHYAIENDRR